MHFSDSNSMQKPPVERTRSVPRFHIGICNHRVKFAHADHDIPLNYYSILCNSMFLPLTTGRKVIMFLKLTLSRDAHQHSTICLKL